MEDDTEYNLGQWLTWKFDLPPLAEQRRIAEILITWDRAIMTLEKLIANARIQKKALMQNLLTGKKRLPGFSGKWTAAELGDVATFRSGGTPSKSDDANWGGDFPWVSARDLKHHDIESAELGLTETGRQMSNTAPKNAILVLVRGMTLLKDVPIGFAMRPLAFNQDIKALIAHSGVDPRYLSYLLVERKRSIMGLVNTANHGTGRLDTDLLKSLPLLFPPLLEQRRLAGIFFANDLAIERQEKLLAKTCAQKAALMQQLLTGKRRVRVAEIAA